MIKPDHIGEHHMSPRNELLAALFLMDARYPWIACYPTSEIIELYEAGMLVQLGAAWALSDEAWQQ